ncbi:MAG: MFS transporter [Deinococcus sp.]|nr:MFS transporter [Deinococcus sp.]
MIEPKPRGERSPQLPAGPDEVTSHNIRYLYLEVAWFGTLAGVIFTFLAVFAVRLGASDFWVSALTSGSALVNVFWLFPAARIVERHAQPLLLILRTTFVFRTSFVLVAMIPLLPQPYQVPVLVAIVILQTFPAGISGVAFTAMLAQVVPAQRLAQVMSVRSALHGIVYTLTVFLGGWWLELARFPWNYSVLFLYGWVGAMIGQWFLSRLKLPERAVTPPTRRARHLLLALRWRLLRRQLSSQGEFVHFTLAALVLQLGLNLPVSLFPIFWVRQLGASDAWVGLLSMVFNGVSVAMYTLVTPLVRRWGNTRLSAYSSMGIALYPLLTALAPSVPALLLPSVVGGAIAAVMNVTLFNRLIEVCPKEQRPTYIGAYSALANLAIFAGPLLGAALAQPLGIIGVFYLATVVRAAGGALFLLRRSL